MRNSTTLSPRQFAGAARTPIFPDYYGEERWALTHARARQARARNALRLVGLMLGVAGLAGALRAWDAGLQP
jgi:hypothetical protein